jgi:hypothetical protein
MRPPTRLPAPEGRCVPCFTLVLPCLDNRKMTKEELSEDDNRGPPRLSPPSFETYEKEQHLSLSTIGTFQLLLPAKGFLQPLADLFVTPVTLL